jgi:hypothetical protein
MNLLRFIPLMQRETLSVPTCSHLPDSLSPSLSSLKNYSILRGRDIAEKVPHHTQQLAGSWLDRGRRGRAGP